MLLVGKYHLEKGKKPLKPLSMVSQEEGHAVSASEGRRSGSAGPGDRRGECVSSGDLTTPRGLPFHFPGDTQTSAKLIPEQTCGARRKPAAILLGTCQTKMAVTKTLTALTPTPTHRPCVCPPRWDTAAPHTQLPGEQRPTAGGQQQPRFTVEEAGESGVRQLSQCRPANSDHRCSLWASVDHTWTIRMCRP